MTSENSAPASVVYLDHAATTPMHPEAAQVLTEQLARTGNASSLHASGRAARRDGLLQAVLDRQQDRAIALLDADIAADFGLGAVGAVGAVGGADASSGPVPG
jgi:hypothetical protein